MNKFWNCTFVCFLLMVPQLAAAPQSATQNSWIGTWATAPQATIPGDVETFRNQTLRLIVHTSTGGTRVRIKISNTFGNEPLIIGSAHIARRHQGHFTHSCAADELRLAANRRRDRCRDVPRREYAGRVALSRGRRRGGGSGALPGRCFLVDY